MNFYGPAECSVAATGTIISHGDKINIGRGIGLNTWVLNTQNGQRLVPIGAVGELWLEGFLMGLGYLSDPQRTSASFFEDPTWLLDGALGISGRKGPCYKTGDLVRYNTNGTLSFVGRKDAQVKLRGQRVELGEVEHHVRFALAEEDIDIVADVILPKRSKNPTLVVFASKRKNLTTESPKWYSRLKGSLEERLANTLPFYMIPSALIPIEVIPMTASGKIDRLKLRKIGESMTTIQLAELNPDQGTDVWQEPITAKEHQLRDLWASVLDIDSSSVGSHHSFFHIGGDPLARCDWSRRHESKIYSLQSPQFLHTRGYWTWPRQLTLLLTLRSKQSSLSRFSRRKEMKKMFEHKRLPNVSFPRHKSRTLCRARRFKKVFLP